jgi:hypothetical protein
MIHLEDTMKKAIILIALLAISFGSFSCGGGGAGPADVPPGEGPGIPSVVRLSPDQFIAQTNSCITLHTTVLDGNGFPVQNIIVTFTNLSAPFGILSSTTANTNSSGIATVNICSTTPGFATILAQIYNGNSNVRDRKSVFFSMNDILAVTMDLDVDSVPGNGIFNEASDFILFSPPPDPDDTVKVRATVRDAGGVPVGGGMAVSWSASHPEAHFLRTDTVTDVNGQATAIVQVTPLSIRDTETTVNVMAFAGNGAANMVTLFLQPVVIDPTHSSLTANPTTVNTGGTSAITAVVKLTSGGNTFDGTVVNFTTKPKTTSDPNPCGSVDPFALTTAGVAKATFTAPKIPGTCTVTGKVGSVTIGTADIKVIKPLSVLPGSATIVVNATSLPFTISGGIPPYSLTSDNPAVVTITPVTVATDGGTFTVSASAVGTYTITVTDTVGSTVTAKITVTATAPAPDFTISCTPTSVNSTTTSACTLTSLNSFSSSVALTCNAPTTGATCALAPASVTPTTSGTSSTLTYTCGAAAAATPFNVSAVSASPAITHVFPMSVTCP